LIRAYLLNHFDPLNRTLFVCYEDLSDPQKDLDIVDTVLRWFYPPMNENEILDWDGKKPATEKNYNGTHSTSKDPVLRQRLRSIVQAVDQQSFDGIVEWADSVFPC